MAIYKRQRRKNPFTKSVLMWISDLTQFGVQSPDDKFILIHPRNGRCVPTIRSIFMYPRSFQRPAKVSDDALPELLYSPFQELGPCQGLFSGPIRRSIDVKACPANTALGFILSATGLWASCTCGGLL